MTIKARNKCLINSDCELVWILYGWKIVNNPYWISYDGRWNSIRIYMGQSYQIVCKHGIGIENRTHRIYNAFLRTAEKKNPLKELHISLECCTQDSKCYQMKTCKKSWNKCYAHQSKRLIVDGIVSKTKSIIIIDGTIWVNMYFEHWSRHNYECFFFCFFVFALFLATNLSFVGVTFSLAYHVWTSPSRVSSNCDVYNW